MKRLTMERMAGEMARDLERAFGESAGFKASASIIADYLHYAVNRAVSANLGRIRREIREERKATMAKWDEIARKRTEATAIDMREDCARIVQGIDLALARVRGERRNGGKSI